MKSIQPIEVNPANLQTYVDRLFGLSMPLNIFGELAIVADGCSYEVCLFDGVLASCRFSWHGGNAPEIWSELEAIVIEMITLFLTLELVTGPV